MKVVERVVKQFDSYIENNNVLEIACGCAEFSIAASKRAARVQCIDIDESRLMKDILEKENVTFRKMDATNLSYSDESFDTVVIYNGIGHLSNDVAKVLDESLRVLNKEGSLIIITGWKLDKAVIENKLIPFLETKGLSFYVEKANGITSVRVEKGES